VWLYPVDGFLIVSDRHRDPAGRRVAAPADAVFAACFEGTLHFLHLLPDAQGGDALDLCGGTGIGALHLSRTARTAVTADVTARAAHFAAFNARLNGSDVESVCGDVYDALGSRQFDLITCHPPYLPAGGEPSVSRDGGETGEDITRRTVAGLPRHLRPGGVAVIASLGCDCTDAPFEQRALSWLGEAAGEFGLAFGLLHTRSIEEVAEGIGRRGLDDDAEAAAWAARLRGRGVARFVYGVLAFKRMPDAGPPLRLAFEPEAQAGDLIAMLAAR
jgi:SAM-dependent methyltransferase